MNPCQHCNYKGYGDDSLDHVTVWENKNGRQACRNCGKLRIHKQPKIADHREALITGDCDDNWYGFRSY